MSKIKAIFDGKVFRPSEAIDLEANTLVELEVETVKPASSQPISFLEVAESLNLEGSPDRSKNIDKYLYFVE